GARLFMWLIWPAISKTVGEPDLPGQKGLAPVGGKMGGAVRTSRASNHAPELRSGDAPGGAGTTRPTGPPAAATWSAAPTRGGAGRAGPAATATRCSVGVSEPPEIHAPAAQARGDDVPNAPRNDTTRVARRSMSASSAIGVPKPGGHPRRGWGLEVSRVCDPT